MTAVGTVIRFDDFRGYGFIAPADGGEDVFFHANDFGGKRHLAQPGLRVMFETAQSDRGLKISSLTVLDEDPVAAPAGDVTQPGGPEDDTCDVLTAAAYSAEVTELLLKHVPALTGQQIVLVRERLVRAAFDHGWIEG
ncbi:cold shock domain-containing protein [Paractinoplanes brasiliensis]|uniref:Putative cold-shock DNA-binding protein n=1 Tax=Paractinoplanes brasiliensis TaxID=52695 RepID=A0A4R6JBS9_9ACTN|nr:cold shock domain-containing protein [Actinoplanes brasiliensis]TDO33194.1 putative cold-shock DNA-binding protein [Actinoplanes brasiliensis]GID33229.1 DNA-binding protein [Actinoplanes brasiliensis]